MTTPQFIAWLDQKMAEHGQGKVIPPTDVITEFLTTSLRKRLEAPIRERILREAGLDGQVEAALARLEPDVRRRADGLGDLVEATLADKPVEPWRAPLERLAAEMADGTPG